MAKQELRRKILATIATVGGLCCALAVCVWLLLTSSMFSTSLQLLMLVCTGGLAAATIGLCIAKISEIRALQKLVKAEELGLARPQEDDGHLQPLHTLDHTRVCAPAAEAAVPVQGGAPAPPQPQAAPETPAPQRRAPAAAPEPVQAQGAQQAQTHHWKPIDFSAADARLRAEEQARQKALAEAQQAQAAMEEAQRLARRQAAEEQARRAAQAQSASAQVLAEKQRLAQAQHQAELARQQAEAEKAAEAQRLAQAQHQAELARQQAEAQRQAGLARQRAEAERAAAPQQWQNAAPQPAAPDPHRAEQIRLAQAARTGQIPHITSAMIEEQRLAAAARRAEEQRLAAQGVQPPKMAPASAASTSPAFAAETQPAAAPAPQQSAKEQWVHSWQAISLDDDTPAAPAAQAVRPRIPHAQPVRPMEQPAAQSPAQPPQTRQPAAPPITWPSQPIPSKYYVTGQMPVVTDEMIEAAKRAAQEAQAAPH
ncbi:MAG: hypothetical protein ACLVKK_04710 [Ruthenibacterium sp.]